MTTKTDIAIKERQEEKYKKPRMWKVIFYNDDFTPFQFVVELLRTIYHKSESEALELAAEIHKTDSGVAGVYTSEIAETKVMETLILISQEHHPLMVTMEAE